jgi:hypothetical protein
MTEQTDLIPMSEDAAASPGFDLVRRGYDPHQVNAHVGWLVEQLREAESHRAAAEAAAAEAAAESSRVRDDLAAGRPAWEEFGGRITQILQLAEEEGAAIRAQRSRDADAHLEEARRVTAEAERNRDATLKEAASRARQIVQAAETEAERLLRETRQTAAEEERESKRKLAELGRQRAQVTGQLGKLRDGLAAAMAPLELAAGPSPLDDDPDPLDAAEAEQAPAAR